MRKYRVHIGYTKRGNDRYAYFTTLGEAANFCGDVFAKRNIVLSITENR